MSSPLIPHWHQPSHPEIQKVIHSPPTSSSSSDEFTTKSISLITLAPYELYAPLTFPPLTYSKVGATYATVQVAKDKHVELNSDLLFVEHSCVPSVIFNTDKMAILAGPNGLKKGEELSFFYPSTEWDMAQGFQCRCGKEGCRGFIQGAGKMGRESVERGGMWVSSHVRVMFDEAEKEKKKLGGGEGVGKVGEEEKDVSGGVGSRELSGEMGGDTSNAKAV